MGTDLRLIHGLDKDEQDFRRLLPNPVKFGAPVEQFFDCVRILLFLAIVNEHTHGRDPFDGVFGDHFGCKSGLRHDLCQDCWVHPLFRLSFVYVDEVGYLGF